MTMKNDAKFEKELTCRFKTDMRNLTYFDPSTQKRQKFALQWVPFEYSQGFIKALTDLRLWEVKTQSKIEF